MSDGHLLDDELLAIAAEVRDTGRSGPHAAHLETCAACSARLQTFLHTLLEAERHLQTYADDGSWSGDAGHARGRARLRERLTAVGAGSLWGPRTPVSVSSLSGGAIAVAAVGLTIVVLAGGADLLPRGGTRTAPATTGPTSTSRIGTGDSGGYRGALPIRSLTPGATVALAADELCRIGPREPSPIPDPVRVSILRAYGMEDLPDHEYELDYLITPDLGGAPDPRNLWPEPYASPVWNAKVKDELEDLLPQLVCEGRVDLATAQREIAADWVAAYKKYFKTDRPIQRS